MLLAAPTAGPALALEAGPLRGPVAGAVRGPVAVPVAGRAASLLAGPATAPGATGSLAGTPSPPPPCDDAVGAAVQREAAGDRDGAIRLLEAALPGCAGHPPLLRELAALHFAAGSRARSGEVAALLLGAAPDDPWGWELLGTLRYLDDDPEGALRAWNRVGRPRVAAVDGSAPGGPGLPLSPRALGLEEGALLTPEGLERGRRRLEAFPPVARARLDYRPVEGGGARVQGAVTRHPPHAFRRQDLPAHGLRALGRRVELAVTDLAGAGERGVATGRADRGYREAVVRLEHPVPGFRRTREDGPGSSPRSGVDPVAAPATDPGASLARAAGTLTPPDGGSSVLGWEARHQRLHPQLGPGADSRISRTGIRLGLHLPPGTRGEGAGWVGVDRWSVTPRDLSAGAGGGAVPAEGVGTHGGAGLDGRLLGPGGLTLEGSVAWWTGGFGTGELRLKSGPLRIRSGSEGDTPGATPMDLGRSLRSDPGRNFTLRFTGSAIAGFGGAPADLMPRFGSGPSATHLARGAPPGSVTLLPPGRWWLHGTTEVSRSWPTVGGITLGPALFIDAVLGMGPIPDATGSPDPLLPLQSPAPHPPRGALHPGVGLRIGVPGVGGSFRIDLALDPRSERVRFSMGW